MPQDGGGGEEADLAAAPGRCYGRMDGIVLAGMQAHTGGHHSDVSALGSSRRGCEAGHASAFGTLCMLVCTQGVELIKCRRASSVAENKPSQAPSSVPALLLGVGVCQISPGFTGQDAHTAHTAGVSVPATVSPQATCGSEPCLTPHGCADARTHADIQRHTETHVDPCK